MLPEVAPDPLWPRVELAALALGSATLVTAIVALAAVEPVAALGVLAGVVVLAVVVARPVRAAYLHLALTPLLAGLPRGGSVPLLRPSELLLSVLIVGVVIRILTDGVAGAWPDAVRRFRPTTLDWSIVAMAVFSSGVPLLWRVARGYRPLLDDLLFATTLWKYLLVFLLFRMVVVDESQVRVCVGIMLAVGAVVGGIAVAQAVGTPGVPEALASVQDESLRAVTNNRGSSTIGTSHGVADLMAFCLAICLGYWRFRIGPRPLVAAGIAFFGLACLGSGQVSAALGLVVVAAVFGWMTRRTWRALAVAVPSLTLAGALLWPVLQARLDSLDQSGMPESWAARRMNLSTYFWPELFSGGNWLLGVRPAARVPAYDAWRDWVYIESGHTWLLWTGGVPLVVAFLWFSRAAMRASLELLAVRRPGSSWLPADEGRFAAALGMGTAISFAVMFVLMTLDVHLTLRGPADALFPLLALVSVPALRAAGAR